MTDHRPPQPANPPLERSVGRAAPSQPYRCFDVALVARARLSESFVRLTLRGADLDQCSTTLLDQRVKLVLGAPDQLDGLLDDDWYAAWLRADPRPDIRTYTLSAVRPDEHEVDVDVVLHGTRQDGAGPASAFAQEAAIGSRLLLVAADRDRPGHQSAGVAYRPGGASRVLLVADETALPAVANILAARADGVRYEALIEVPHDSDTRPLAADRVIWRVRARGESLLDVPPFDSAEGDGDVPEEGVLWEEAEGAPRGSYLWAAGEAGVIRAIRSAAKRAGFDRGTSSFMGYWRRGLASE